MGDVEVGSGMLVAFDEVEDADGVVGRGDRSAVFGCDGDVVSEPVLAATLSGRERAEQARRADDTQSSVSGVAGVPR